jgi:hypothetical protein
MAKLVWRVKLVTELRAGETTEIEVARIERDEQADLSDLGLRLAEAKQLVLSALAPASIADRMKVEIFQAACNTLRTVAVRRRKWNLR